MLHVTLVLGEWCELLDRFSKVVDQSLDVIGLVLHFSGY